MSRSESSIFERNVPGTTERLQMATVGIAGCGGLGSNAAASLARAGVGRLILVDHDRVELSNLNRQHYFQTDVGKAKVEALAGHLRAINPDIDLVLHDLELTPQNTPEIFAEAEILIEAFDRAELKRWLIEAWCTAFPDRPIVCGSGLSGIGNTNALRVHSAGRIHFCGDEESDMSLGLCAARVGAVANMQANVAIELLMGLKP
ncbi:MAG TPA: sulfur carrier protein ThiS adenylyltransferase ThiF [Candidatus Eisenbacteria bacterium]|uniref:Sulfur carrier protein ThiS adenylyltransferase ThiF n=1 Tax=Eiseniibacteriota bacterium TaxID=2212470 RepID=A0A7V2F3C1_UNCEI|nr:sulfur carrier protein ThiS adenylyltransferase ThiF [Candidatus Eisenbacteria bacterium]